ncbi:MAG: META domain-containing protein [Chitinophagaceae bacterium]
MKNIFVAGSLLMVIVLFACNTPKTAASTDNGVITETYWRLTELNGKPIGPTPPDKKEVYLRLRKNGNIEGFGGCNGFGGHVEIKEGASISFTNMMGTMMACDNLATENKLFEALRETDNYIHNGKRLMLNKGKKAPMARFEADYSK